MFPRHPGVQRSTALHLLFPGCSFLLLALAAPCLAAPQAKETDPWLQVLNGGSSREVQEVQEAQERQGVQEEELVPQELQPERQEPLQPAQPPPRPQPLAPRPRPQRPAPRPRPGQNQRFPGPRRRPSRRPAGPRRPGARPPAPAQDKGIVGNLVDGITGGIDSLTCAGQNWFSDEKLKDEEFIKFQLNCARGLGPCDEIGDKIKSKSIHTANPTDQTFTNHTIEAEPPQLLLTQPNLPQTC